MKKSTQNYVSRIIDANSNRITEGLRVVEDISRFVLNDKNLTFEFKKIRHSITDSLKKLKIDFVTSRDSEGDVGVSNSIISEFKRIGFIDLVRANMQRVEEGLRVLEETTKIIKQKISREFKRTRFKIYTLEKNILKKLKPEIDLSLYAIIDREFLKGKNIRNIVNNLIDGKATVIQYRDKISCDKEIVAICKYIRKVTEKHNVGFIINDRPDIALVTNADGVHIGKNDIGIKSARQILGDKIIGATAHTIKEAKESMRDGADYIGAGPIFKTGSKDFLPEPKGVKFIKQIKSYVSIPLVAIGGINADNVSEVIKAGADGIATLSFVISSKNISYSTKILYNSIKRIKNDTNRIS